MTADIDPFVMDIATGSGRQFRIDVAVFIAELQLGGNAEKADPVAESAALRKAAIPAEALEGLDDSQVYALVIRVKVKLQKLGNALAP